MQFFVISMTTFAFFIAVIVFGYFGRRSDDKKRRIDYISELGEKDKSLATQDSFYNRYLKKYIKNISTGLTKQGSKSKVQKSREKDQIVERQLRLSGVFMSAQEFGSIKLTFMFICFVTTALMALILPIDLLLKALVFLIGSVAAIIGPSFFLKSKVKGHQQKIRDQLPDAMDLLGVCIEAGLSFDIALIKVSERLKGPFIDELLIVHREIQMGRTRRDALQNLIACTDIPELKTFVSALAQAEQLGIPIINVMRIQSAQLRVIRKQIAQEKGMKAPVKILLPMIVFIFPVIFIILLGPTIINLLEEFAN